LNAEKHSTMAESHNARSNGSDDVKHLHFLCWPDNEDVEILTLTSGENWLQWSEEAADEGERPRLRSLATITEAADPGLFGDKLAFPTHQEINSQSSTERCYLCFDVDGPVLTVKDMRDPVPDDCESDTESDAWTAQIQKGDDTSGILAIARRQMKVVYDQDSIVFVDSAGENRLSMEYRCITETKATSPVQVNEMQHASLMELENSDDNESEVGYPFDATDNAKEAILETKAASRDISDPSTAAKSTHGSGATQNHKEENSPLSVGSESTAAAPTQLQVHNTRTMESPTSDDASLSPSITSTAAPEMITQLQGARPAAETQSPLAEAQPPISIHKATAERAELSQMSAQSDGEEDVDKNSDQSSETPSESELKQDAVQIDSTAVGLSTQLTDDNASIADDSITVDPLDELACVHRSETQSDKIKVPDQLEVQAGGDVPENLSTTSTVDPLDEACMHPHAETQPCPPDEIEVPEPLGAQTAGDVQEDDKRATTNPEEPTILPIDIEERSDVRATAELPAPEMTTPAKTNITVLQSPNGLCSPDLLGGSPSPSPQADPGTPAESTPQKSESLKAPVSHDAVGRPATESPEAAPALAGTKANKISETTHNGDESPMPDCDPSLPNIPTIDNSVQHADNTEEVALPVEMEQASTAAPDGDTGAHKDNGFEQTHNLHVEAPRKQKTVAKRNALAVETTDSATPSGEKPSTEGEAARNAPVDGVSRRKSDIRSSMKRTTIRAETDDDTDEISRPQSTIKSSRNRTTTHAEADDGTPEVSKPKRAMRSSRKHTTTDAKANDATPEVSKQESAIRSSRKRTTTHAEADDGTLEVSRPKSTIRSSRKKATTDAKPVNSTPDVSRPKSDIRSSRKRATACAESDTTQVAQLSTTKRSRRTLQTPSSSRQATTSPHHGESEGTSIRILATGFDLDNKQKKVSTPLFNGDLCGRCTHPCPVVTCYDSW
jgi:hypothetical protein